MHDFEVEQKEECDLSYLFILELGLLKKIAKTLVIDLDNNYNSKKVVLLEMWDTHRTTSNSLYY